MAYDDFTAKMVSRVHELEKALVKKDLEIATWKVAHAEVVRRNRLLRNRLDLPIERVRSYDEMMQAIANKDREIAELKQRMQRDPEEWESVCGECNGSGWR